MKDSELAQPFHILDHIKTEHYVALTLYLDSDGQLLRTKDMLKIHMSERAETNSIYPIVERGVGGHLSSNYKLHRYLLEKTINASGRKQ